MSDNITFSVAGLRRRLVITWQLFVNYAYDYRRFRKASFIAGSRSRENLRAHIHLLAHTLEYGMALSDPRKGFGIEKVALLCKKTQLYLQQFARTCCPFHDAVRSRLCRKPVVNLGCGMRALHFGELADVQWPSLRPISNPAVRTLVSGL